MKRKKRRRGRFKIGPVQEKILLLLLAGVGLALVRSPRTYFKIARVVRKEWKNINRKYLRRSIISLYRSKLVSERENKDGTITLVLAEKGKKLAYTFNIDKIKIKKSPNWDKKWRMVLFDIPEKRRREREALRMHLKKLGFHAYQKSAFVLPWECKKEIEFIIEFYRVRPYVRFVLADKLDNELDLRGQFSLI